MLKRSVKAYILLESLLAMGLLALITGVVLESLVHARMTLVELNEQIEVFNVAEMGLSAGAHDLRMNGVHVKIVTVDQKTIVYNGDKKEIELNEIK